MKILITGGSGFIGSTLIKFLLAKNHKILNVDCLSKYSVNESLLTLNQKLKNNYFFKKIDISNYNSLNIAFNKFKPDSVIHVAAQSHVDRSISDPKVFIRANIIGTFNLLEVSRKYLKKIKIKNKFKFLHISTDEIYGELKKNEKKFTEKNNIKPSSPYSASKASSDLLVESWNKTYNLPTIITNCSNNFGPWQFPEKLIPVIILSALDNKKIPIYGNGKNIRDWIDVRDHVRALDLVLRKGKIGERYNIGTDNQLSNITIAKKICSILDKIKNKKNIFHEKLISYINDRAGHDFRYAINNEKITKDLHFKSKYKFEKSLEDTVLWYLDNLNWAKNKLK